MDAIKTQHFDSGKIPTTTIINADDAIIGTGAFVKSSTERGKKENMRSCDFRPTKCGQKCLGFERKESLVVVLITMEKSNLLKGNLVRKKFSTQLS